MATQVEQIRYASTESSEAIPEALRLEWSRWSRYASSLSLALTPSQPGIFAIAEEIAAPGEAGKRMLAVLQVGPAEDLSRALARMFAPGSPLAELARRTRCFIRYAVVPDAVQRQMASTSLQNWMAASSEAAAGIVSAVFEQPAVKKEAELTPRTLPAGF